MCFCDAVLKLVWLSCGGCWRFQWRPQHQWGKFRGLVFKSFNNNNVQMNPEDIQEDSAELEGAQTPENSAEIEAPGQPDSPEGVEVFPPDLFTNGTPLNNHQRVQNQMVEEIPVEMDGRTLVMPEIFKLELGPLTFVHDPTDGLTDKSGKTKSKI